MSQQVHAPWVGHYLSLDDVEEEVWVAAAAQQVAQAQRLVEAFDLFLHLWRRSTRRTPAHRNNKTLTQLYVTLQPLRQ